MLYKIQLKHITLLKINACKYNKLIPVYIIEINKSQKQNFRRPNTRSLYKPKVTVTEYFYFINIRYLPDNLPDEASPVDTAQPL